jgi:hypothetical protein
MEWRKTITHPYQGTERAEKRPNVRKVYPVTSGLESSDMVLPLLVF